MEDFKFEWQTNAGRRNGKTQRRQTEWESKAPFVGNMMFQPLPHGFRSLYQSRLWSPSQSPMSNPSKPQLGYRVWRTHHYESPYDTVFSWGSQFGVPIPLSHPPKGTIKPTNDLRSLMFDSSWAKGTNTAMCRSDYPLDGVDPEPHVSPSSGCACGFWCHSTPGPFEKPSANPLVNRMYVADSTQILGAIMYWGHCIEHEAGIRVQHAQVIALHKGDHVEEQVRAISEKYDVPWFDKLAEMMTYAKGIVDSSDRPMFDPTSPPV